MFSWINHITLRIIAMKLTVEHKSQHSKLVHQ